MARISVFGGTGYAGGSIVREAARRGHQVTSHSRTLPEEKVAGVEYVVGSLLDESDRAKALDGADVAIVAAAARGDIADTLRGGIAALAAQAEEAGVRLGVVGGTGSLRVTPDGPRVYDTPDFPAEYRPESLTMGAVLDDLRATGSLDWFYVSPAATFGAYNPGEARGTYRIGTDVLLTDENGNSDISGADFGLAIVDEIERHDHRRAHLAVAY
ncbi:MAG TPA: NAD(P)H-binding protein [Blastococcus sp.]|nr:NAD(P)H-binding protein [Blastococcus sp.]